VRLGLGVLPLPSVMTVLLGHLANCFGALLMVGYVADVYHKTLAIQHTPQADE